MHVAVTGILNKNAVRLNAFRSADLILIPPIESAYMANINWQFAF